MLPASRRVKALQEPAAHYHFSAWERIELGGAIEVLKDFTTFAVLMHREQNRLEPIDQRRRQIAAHGKQVAR